MQYGGRYRIRKGEYIHHCVIPDTRNPKMALLPWRQFPLLPADWYTGNAGLFCEPLFSPYRANNSLTVKFRRSYFKRCIGQINTSQRVISRLFHCVVRKRNDFIRLFWKIRRGFLFEGYTDAGNKTGTAHTLMDKYTAA